MANRLDLNEPTPSDQEAILADPEVQALMQHMVDQSSYSIHPKVDSKGINYPEIAATFPNKTESETKELLDKLVQARVFTSKLLDKVILCPTCSSASVYSKYNCPRCSSFDIGKAQIIEHVRCGFIGSLEKFRKGSQLICPKCSGIVTEIEYRKIGTSFECNSCGSRFEAPKISHKCNSCDDVFTSREARYEPIFEYSLSEQTKKSLAGGRIPLASIASILREKGYDVGIKADLVGKSGATHTFDIIARKANKLVVAKFTFEPKEEDIIGLFAKKYDIDPTYTLLIALSAPSKEEEAVSKAYGVKILYSSGGVPIGEQILKFIDSGSVEA
jgi:Thaumarchaeal output domain 1